VIAEWFGVEGVGNLGGSGKEGRLFAS